jgi:hypothetical protein
MLSWATWACGSGVLPPPPPPPPPKPEEPAGLTVILFPTAPLILLSWLAEAAWTSNMINARPRLTASITKTTTLLDGLRMMFSNDLRSVLIIFIPPYEFNLLFVLNR